MASEIEQAIDNLSDGELLIWHEQSGAAGMTGLPRLKRERLGYLLHQAAIAEAAPPRRMSPWEWERLRDADETIEAIRVAV